MMSSTQSSSESSTSSDSEPPRRRPSLSSSTLPRRTMSSSMGSRNRPAPLPLPPRRTTSTGSEDWGHAQLTSRRLSQVPSQSRDQTMSEFLRDDLIPQLPDNAAETRRQAMVAFERKRRLTSSGHDGGRRRTTHGGFHERGSSGQSFGLGESSSTRQRDWSERADSRELPPPPVIDLTGSSPTATPAPVTPMPPPHSLSVRQMLPVFQAQSRASSSSSRRYTIPRWQPDSDAAECPICGRTFGILFRRHHCRKCGRVVCNDCSPHRITIPRSLIVNPPGPGLTSPPIHQTANSPGRIDTIDLTGDDDNTSQDTGSQSRAELEGGAKVRLCNPCVPDPQPEPPEEYSLPIQPSRPQSFAESRAARVATFLRNTPPNLSPLVRNVTSTTPLDQSSAVQRNYEIQGSHSSMPTIPARPFEPSHYQTNRNPQAFFNSSFINQYAPRQNSNPASTVTPSLDEHVSHFQRLMAAGMPLPPSSTQLSRGYPSNLNHTRYQSLDSGSRIEPLSSRPRIRSMHAADPDFQRAIGVAVGHPPYNPEPQRMERPQYQESDICPVCRRLLPPLGVNGDESAREAHIVECINSRDPSSQSSYARQQQLGQPLIPRAPVQMVPFVATEKDCLGEDGTAQECSICMVEYDEGDQLARLECLCKFHKECIVEWFGRKQECPLHKIA